MIVVISSQVTSRGSAYSGGRIAATAAAQMNAGRMPRALMVMLPALPGGRSGHSCLDVPGGPQAGTFVTQDLPQLMARYYRAASGPAHWAVVGGTGGGYCALQLATAPAGTFGIAVARPGTYTQPPGAGQASASPWLRAQDNLLWRLRNWPPPPVRVLFAGPGRARQFLSLVRPPLTATTASLAAGHWPLAPVLDWAGRALAGSR